MITSINTNSNIITTNLTVKAIQQKYQKENLLTIGFSLCWNTLSQILKTSTLHYNLIYITRKEHIIFYYCLIDKRTPKQDYCIDGYVIIFRNITTPWNLWNTVFKATTIRQLKTTNSHTRTFYYLQLIEYNIPTILEQHNNFQNCSSFTTSYIL